MIQHDLKRLEFLVETIPSLLTALEEDAFSAKSQKNKWSSKEIIGHLIDSATNNHQRFVRVQFEDNPAIAYNQDNWNKHGFYQQISGAQIISFWAAYNRQLAELIRRIPTESLQRTCMVGDKVFTLEFLIHDYVVHMEHHLRRVVDY